MTAPLTRITTWLYDADSRLVATIDPLALRTSFAYDVASNLIRITNPLGQINTSIFDLGNRVSAQIDPVGNRTSYSYDASWNMIRVTNPLGFITTSVFDTKNRLAATVGSTTQSHEHELRSRQRSDSDDKPARLYHHERVRQAAEVRGRCRSAAQPDDHNI